MIELKITGNDAAEFGTKAIQTLALIINGAKRTTTAAEEPKAPANDAAPVAAEPVVEQVAEPLENPKASDPPPAEKPKRGRKKATESEPVQTDIEDAIAKFPEGGDPVPDLTQKPAAPAEPAKSYTVEDCRAALRRVLDNHEKRARDAGEKNEDKLMTGKIAYAKPLLYGFGAQKVTDLKPEQYAEFMETAKPYIDGTAEEQKEAA